MDISDRLIALASFYHREAGKCLRGKAYFAASVMQVTVLEAALQAMCFLYPTEVKRTRVFGKKRFRKKRYRALEFSLYELINIADELAWFPPKRIKWGAITDTLAGFTHEIRWLRNHIHPGVWARERTSEIKFKKSTFDTVFEVFEVANSWLLHRVHASLRKRMKREGLI